MSKFGALRHGERPCRPLQRSSQVRRIQGNAFACCAIAVVLGVLAVSVSAAQSRRADIDGEGRRLYEAACSTCHGPDGLGMDEQHVGFEEELPDFTDCRFAAREPDADWLGVVHLGGPSRSFSKMMPSFSGLLDQDQIGQILGYVRTFCHDGRWPRGELNLPRALVTEKAFPEDEVVLEIGAAAEGPTDVGMALVYEKRFGPSNQVEVTLPMGWVDRGRATDGVEVGLGDIAVGLKRVLFHDHARGSIFSATAEAVLPTGEEDEGLGKGYAVFEPFLTFGQILPADGFLQLQGGLEIPIDESAATEKAFLRAAVGRTWSKSQFSRAWSPMIEVLAVQELESGADLHWDLLPQFQVALNNRQHVLANLGVRIPMNDRDRRATQILFYVLWDWFDGGLFDGW